MDLIITGKWREDLSNNSYRGFVYINVRGYDQGSGGAAGLANIEILEKEDIPRRVKTTGKIFENALRGLDDLDVVGEVRGSHFMMGIEFVADKTTKETFSAETNFSLQLAQSAQKRGLIARPLANILILSPTLIMDEPMIMDIEGILRESIIETATKVRA